MMQDITLAGFKIPNWIYLPVIYVIWVICGLVVKKIAFRSIRLFTKRTATRIDDAFIEAANLPLSILIFTSGGVLLEGFIPFPEQDIMKHPFFLGFKMASMLAIVFFVNRFFIGMISFYFEKI